MPRTYKTWDDRSVEAEAHPFWTTLKWVLGVTVVVLIVVALVGLATTGSLFFQGEAAKHTVGARTNIKVYSPENKIAQIAFFHDTCNTANAQLRIVENNQDRLKTDTKAARSAQDPIRQQQASDSLVNDQQDVTGALNALQATVANYNSRSAQSTANIFKDANLPERIVLPNPISAGYTINCG